MFFSLNNQPPFMVIMRQLVKCSFKGLHNDELYYIDKMVVTILSVILLLIEEIRGINNNQE